MSKLHINTSCICLSATYPGPATHDYRCQWKQPALESVAGSLGAEAPIPELFWVSPSCKMAMLILTATATWGPSRICDRCRSFVATLDPSATDQDQGLNLHLHGHYARFLTH